MVQLPPARPDQAADWRQAAALAVRKDSARRLARRIYGGPAEPPQCARPADRARAAASRFARSDCGGAAPRRRQRREVGDNGRRAVAIARVLWQSRPTDSLRDEDEQAAMPGTRGSTYVDITAQDNATGAITRVQTIDTLANGSPTAREAAAAARIQSAFPNDALQLIPKQ
jgi:hypothetical protein